MPSFNQYEFTKKNKVIASLLVIIVMLSAVYFFKNFQSQKQSTVRSVPVLETQAQLFIKPAFNRASVQDDADFEVRIDSQGELIKGLALRIVFPYENDIPFAIEQSPFDLMDVPVEQNWIVAVNSMRDTGEEIIADVSVINTNPAGYAISNDSAFFMLRAETLNTLVKNGEIKIESDPSQLATSDGSVMTFEVVTETYTIE